MHFGVGRYFFDNIKRVVRGRKLRGGWNDNVDTDGSEGASWGDSFLSTRYSVRLAKSRPPFVRSIASLSGAVFASTAVKMVRDGKRSPAPPPEPAEGDAGPGQQRPKKRGRGRPRKEEGTDRSRSRPEGRRASQRIAEKETSTNSTGDILSPRLKEKKTLRSCMSMPTG
mmetsp:Transcript_15644/g.35088  ORF Transcript_15644/g.35088 Transcript_15644/m.35088 type:complete len:169 (-) Transcript_15644:203-709(-)